MTLIACGMCGAPARLASVPHPYGVPLKIAQPEVTTPNTWHVPMWRTTLTVVCERCDDASLLLWVNVPVLEKRVMA